MNRAKKMYGQILAIGLLAMMTTSCAPSTSLVPVKELKVEQYLGTWYDVASFPQTFQDGCHCTTATYDLREDGDISVLNKCRKESIDGEPSEATARAFIPDTTEPGKLKVEFFPFFAADYWVIELGVDGENPYTYAVVSEPGQDYLWILSRTAAMDQAVYDEVLLRLEDMGFDLSQLNKTPQEGCSS